MGIYGKDLAGIFRNDLVLVEGLENLRVSIIRRLNTRPGSLFAHPAYGNPVWDILGEGLSEEWVEGATVAIRECLSQEPRLKRFDITCEIFPESSLAKFYINYVPITSQVAENLVWEVQAGG